MSAQNVAVVRRAYGALNRGDVAGWREVVDPEVVFVDQNPAPDATGTLHGREAAERYFRRWADELEGFRGDVHEFVAVGDHVVCAVTWRGTGRGSAAAVEWRGADVATVRDGRIVRFESGFVSKEAALEAVFGATHE